MARDNFKDLRNVWAFGRGAFGFAAGAVRIGVGAYQLSQALKPEPELIDQKGEMEGFAMGGELERYQYDPDGFYLGRIHEDHGTSFEASMPADDDRHIFIVAGSASGKGISLGIQNGLRWRGPLLTIDPKGEMAERTAMHRGTKEKALETGTSVRKFKNQKVAILDPMGVVRGPSKRYRVRYDPMSDIDMSIKGGRRQINKLAAGMVVPEDGKNAHFSDNAETLIAGTVEAVMLKEKPENHTLPFIRQVIMGKVKPTGFRKPPGTDIAFPGQGKPKEPVFDEEESKVGFAVLLDYLEQEGVPEDGLAGEAAAILTEVLDSEEAGSFRTTLSRNMKWLADLDMQAHLAPSDFSLWDAVQDGWSVYIVLKPDDIADFRNWLRMIVQISLSAKMAMGDNQEGLQTLFFLDEFAALGRFKEIEHAAGYMRGYGMKLAPVIQNIGQVKNLYEKNWETFLGNAGAIIAWGLNDLETEEYIANRLGRVYVKETSTSTSSGISGMNASTNRSSSTSFRERPVRYSNEVHDQGARETMRAFVIPASGKGFIARRVPYMELKKHKLYDSPDHIREWENDRSQKGG